MRLFSVALKILELDSGWHYLDVQQHCEELSDHVLRRALNKYAGLLLSVKRVMLKH